MPWTPNYRGWMPSPTWQPDPPLPKVLRLLAPDARIVDVGAGGRRVTPGTIAIDYVASPGTTVQADAHALCLRDDCADAVISTGTFEHVRDPLQVLSECARALKSGGILHVEVPFAFPYHPDPGDYTRWTLEGLREMCRRAGILEVDSGVNLGPASALNMALIAYARSYFAGRRMRRLVYVGLSILLVPHRYLDRFLIRRPHANELACGVYFTGRKS